MKFSPASIFGFHVCEILECDFINYNNLNEGNVGLCVWKTSNHLILHSNITQSTYRTDVCFLTAA
jgi:hypothetical protein